MKSKLVVADLLSELKSEKLTTNAQDLIAYEKIYRSHKFRVDLSQEAMLESALYAVELYRHDLLFLPFDVCYFEFLGSMNHTDITCLLCWENNGEILCRLYEKKDRGVVTVPATFKPFSYDQSEITRQLFDKCVFWFDPENIKLKNVSEKLKSEYTVVNFQSTYAHAGIMRFFVAACLGSLSLRGVSRDVIKPSALSNKIRTNSGRIPLFSHNIVSVKNDPSPIVSFGLINGDRRSPRLHWRRGHIRRYTNGKVAGIPPMLVGDKSLGIISHEYQVAA